MMNFAAFTDIVETAITRFEQNAVLQLAAKRQFTVAQYRKLLLSIYHQTLEAPASFAMAAATCRLSHKAASEYLVKHAEEEQLHYKWVEDDLKRAGYDGPSVQHVTPSREALAYVSFNFYMAYRFPLGRLACAAFLESLAATIGPKYGPLIMGSVGLPIEAFSFMSSHTVTDAEHAVELMSVVEALSLTEFEWDWMVRAVETACDLYIGIYDGSVRSAD